jgi:receptor protein-tyrosine kinase
MFNAERESGLLDLLRDPAMSLEAAVMPTNVPGLSVLPAGARDPQSAELLASSRMQSLCRSLSESDPQRIFIFDSSPLLATTESGVLASHVGQILVVVRANDTPQKAVTSALEKLDQSKAICLVLNRLYGKDGDGGHSDYGYGTYGA